MNKIKQFPFSVGDVVYIFWDDFFAIKCMKIEKIHQVTKNLVICEATDLYDMDAVYLFGSESVGIPDWCGDRPRFSLMPPLLIYKSLTEMINKFDIVLAQHKFFNNHYK